MNCKRFAPLVVLTLSLSLLTGCGEEFTLGAGTLTVDGLAAADLVICGSTGDMLEISGSGFLSEHGNEVMVTFTAEIGTPFSGQASETVLGTAVSNTLVLAMIPSITGVVENVRITVTLPGSNFGVSPPGTITIGGTLTGPSPRPDTNLILTGHDEITGNVTYNAPAPGVLGNDEHARCVSEEEYGEEFAQKPGADASTHLGVLSVVNPPAFRPDDATPGMIKPTAQGGTVEIRTDGSFDYEPPLGYGDGATDSFTYWMEDAARPGESRPASATLTIGKVVWFIDDAAGNTTATGRFSDPFPSLLAFNSVQNVPPVGPFETPMPVTPNTTMDDRPQEGDCIFIYDNTMPIYDGGIRLRDQQGLYGQGVDFVLNNLSISAGGSPLLTGGSGSGGRLGPVIVLGTENEVRGVDTTGGSNGIFGFAVSGPTIIDQVSVQDSDESGIRLDGTISGRFDIGDPAGDGTTAIDIDGSGFHGIEIGGFETTALTLPTAVTAGDAEVFVFAADITDSQQGGIDANLGNLSVDQTTIDDCDVGIGFRNFSNLLCTLDVTDTEIGVTTPPTFRGIVIVADDSPLTATISDTESHSANEALYAVAFGYSPLLQIAVDDCTFESTVTGTDPTVHVQGAGSGPEPAYVTRLEDNDIIGNGSGGGYQFVNVAFDDPDTMGPETIAGGDTTVGQAAGARVEDTAFRCFNCSGALSFDTLTIFQTGGSATGFAISGTLTITPMPPTVLDVN